jgi:hypothetical protein
LIALVPSSGAHGAGDLWDLFQPNAPWARAAVHINVLGISVQVMAGGKDDDLQRMIADLRQRNISLGSDMLPLSGPDSAGKPLCGYHGESYSAPGETGVLARRMNAPGATWGSHGMDEQLSFGHYYRGPNACRGSIAAIAQDTGQKVKDARA